MDTGRGGRTVGWFLKQREATWLVFFFVCLVAVGMIASAFLPLPFTLAVVGLLFLAFVFATTILYRASVLDHTPSVHGDQFKSILLTMDDALIVYDEDFRVIFFNPAAEKLFSIPAQTILGEKLEASQAERPELRLLVQVIFPSLAPVMIPRSESGAESQTMDIEFSDPELQLRVLSSRIRDERGEMLGFMKLVRNRTREITLMKSKSDFIAVASHQLRTPLTHITFALQSLVQATEMNADTKFLIENANTSAHELEAIVSDLLNVTKIEEGKFGYEFAETDIVQFLEKVLEEIVPQARALGIKIFFDRPKEELSRVYVDSQKLTMAISNLVDNALRYNVKNGEVTLTARSAKESGFVEVLVSDTGIGIPPEELPKLFQKFYRATNAQKAVTEGSGLGLYIVQNIVRAHGGKIWAESELNRGTIFHFTLSTSLDLLPKHEAGIEY